MTSVNCPDRFLLFLYKEILLAWESRSAEVKLPRKLEAAGLLDKAGITVIPADNKKEMELKLKNISGDVNTLVLLTDKKAVMDQLFRNLRNAVAHGDFRCQRRGSTVEIFHEYRHIKRLFGTLQQQCLRKLVDLMKIDG